MKIQRRDRERDHFSKWSLGELIAEEYAISKPFVEALNNFCGAFIHTPKSKSKTLMGLQFPQDPNCFIHGS